MSMAFVTLGRMVFVTTLRAVELSVWMGIHGCLCPISINVAHIVTVCHALINNTLSSALAMDDMMALMTFTMLWIVPLLWGNSSFVDRKKCPPAWLLDLGTLR